MRILSRAALATLLLASATGCEDDLVAPPPDVVIPTNPAVVRFVPDVSSTTVGSLVSVEVRIENGYDVGAVPFHIRYNYGILHFEPPAAQGAYLSMDGASTVFTVSEPAPGGDIEVQLYRTGTGPGASGSGLLATFGFRAIQPGRVPFTFTGASVKDPDGDNRPASFVGTSLAVAP